MPRGELGAERGQLAHQPVAAGFQDQLLLGLRARDPVAEIGQLMLEALQPLLLGVAQLGRLRGAPERRRLEQGARLRQFGEREAARRVVRHDAQPRQALIGLDPLGEQRLAVLRRQIAPGAQRLEPPRPAARRAARHPEGDWLPRRRWPDRAGFRWSRDGLRRGPGRALAARLERRGRLGATIEMAVGDADRALAAQRREAVCAPALLLAFHVLLEQGNCLGRPAHLVVEAAEQPAQEGAVLGGPSGQLGLQRERLLGELEGFLAPPLVGIGRDQVDHGEDHAGAVLAVLGEARPIELFVDRAASSARPRLRYRTASCRSESSAPASPPLSKLILTMRS